jgi:anti-anti-sigma regulatory factor
MSWAAREIARAHAPTPAFFTGCRTRGQRRRPGTTLAFRAGMLRISPIPTADGGVVLRLEGRLVGPWVAELRKACEGPLRAGRGLTLDAAAVSFIDGDGLALVKALQTRRVRLMHCSPFVAEQLRGLRHADR